MSLVEWMFGGQKKPGITKLAPKKVDTRVKVKTMTMRTKSGEEIMYQDFTVVQNPTQYLVTEAGVEGETTYEKINVERCSIAMAYKFGEEDVPEIPAYDEV